MWPTRGVLCVARACRCGDELERRLQLSPAWRSCMRATLPRLVAAAERRVGAELIVAASLRTCSVCVLRSGAMRVVCRRRRPAGVVPALCTRAMSPNCVVAVASVRAPAQSTAVRGAEHARATHGQLCAAGVSLHVGWLSPSYAMRASMRLRMRERNSAAAATVISLSTSCRASTTVLPKPLYRAFAAQLAHSRCKVATQPLHSCFIAASAAWRCVTASACTCCGVAWPGWPSACARALSSDHAHASKEAATHGLCHICSRVGRPVSVAVGAIRRRRKLRRRSRHLPMHVEQTRRRSLLWSRW